MDMQDKLGICKVVAHAILVDGQLADSERELLDKLMDRYELSDAQKKEARNRNIDDDPVALAAQVSTESHEELLREVANMICVDGEATGAEKNLLSSVARSLGMNEDEAQATFLLLTKV